MAFERLQHCIPIIFNLRQRLYPSGTHFVNCCHIILCVGVNARVLQAVRLHGSLLDGWLTKENETFRLVDETRKVGACI
jgi:hypothetical protein